MDTETLSVSERRSKHAQQGKLILSVIHVSGRAVEFVIGRVGSPNVERELIVGGANHRTLRELLDQPRSGGR